MVADHFSPIRGVNFNYEGGNDRDLGTEAWPNVCTCIYMARKSCGQSAWKMLEFFTVRNNSN